MRYWPRALGRLCPHHTVLATFLLMLAAATAPATAQQASNGSCGVAPHFEQAAFDQPMQFARASNKGNMSTSAWIVAVGRIDPATPARFQDFLDGEDYLPGNIVMNSPGGNLAAGLELGRMIRAAGLTTHIGTTIREFSEPEETCDTWWDSVEPGICASSCAYAFLGGRTRFVDSPYYPVEGNLLGFHQFYGSPDRGADTLSTEQVSAIEASTLSVAQALTGQIVLYAMEMGIDPRIVAFASTTSSDELYFPSNSELEELGLATRDGLGAWFMEPYGEGLITAARPHRPTSLLEQVTAFCRDGSGEPRLLITMDLATPSYPNPADLPLNALELTIDDQQHRVPRSDLDVRYGDQSIFITAPVGPLATRLMEARTLAMRLDAARVMGNFREGRELGETERQSLALAWRNCI